MNILIIGAGAAGLMAADLLSKKGHGITILEARARIGGRCYTKRDGSFAKPVELGAEFVHGDLPVTLGLLREAGIAYHKTAGEMWHFRDGHFYEDDANGGHWGELMDRLNALTEDCPIKTFLEKEFPGAHYADFRKSIDGFVQGMDAADPADASAFALRKEWGTEDEDQYRIEGGYGRLMDYLKDQSEAHGAVLHHAQIVKEIQWEAGGVGVVTSAGRIFKGDKAIITLPVGVLQAPPGGEGAVAFLPGLPAYTAAIQALGSGNALKILMQFREPFWKAAAGQDLAKLGFMLSAAPIPTWWTQYPEHSTLLTGWVGGPQAFRLKDLSREELLRKALQSLSEIFNLPEEKIRQQIDAYEVVAWPAAPYSRGSYSYATIASKAALSVLRAPVADTLYFAGEAIYDGPAMGTVEAALTSAKEVADHVSRQQ